MNDTLFGIHRNELSVQLKALGLDPDISTIKEMNVEDYNDLRSDDIEAEQSYRIKWHKIKDWSDYTKTEEKYKYMKNKIRTDIYLLLGDDLYHDVKTFFEKFHHKKV